MRANQLVEGIVHNVVTVAADYTLTKNDQVVVVDSADPVIITIPVSLTIGKTFSVIRKGAGTATIDAQVGVTIHSVGDVLAIADQYGSADIVVVSLNYAIVQL